MSDNASESFDMSEMTHAQTADEMRRHVITVGDQQPGETIERMIWRAARRLRETYQRSRSYYHLSARKIEAHQLLNARRRAKEITRQRLRAQIVALEVQQRHDLDAMAAQLPILLGPLYPYAVKAGLVNPEAVAAQEDGEA